MTRISLQVVTEGLPFHQSIREAILQLGHDILFDADKSTMGLKALLFLLTKTTVGSGHEEIRSAIREAIQACSEVDYRVLPLYDQVVIHLELQAAAATAIRREEDAADVRTREREHAIRVKEEAQEKREGELSEWDDRLDYKKAELERKEQELAALQAKLARKKKRKAK